MESILVDDSGDMILNIDTIITRCLEELIQSLHVRFVFLPLEMKSLDADTSSSYL